VACSSWLSNNGEQILGDPANATPYETAKTRWSHRQRVEQPLYRVQLSSSVSPPIFGFDVMASVPTPRAGTTPKGPVGITGDTYCTTDQLNGAIRVNHRVTTLTGATIRGRRTPSRTMQPVSTPVIVDFTVAYRPGTGTYFSWRTRSPLAQLGVQFGYGRSGRRRNLRLPFSADGRPAAQQAGFRHRGPTRTRWLWESRPTVVCSPFTLRSSDRRGA